MVIGRGRTNIPETTFNCRLSTHPNSPRDFSHHKRTADYSTNRTRSLRRMRQLGADPRGYVFNLSLVHPGNKSVGLTAEELGAYDADIILVAPCGFDRKRATSDGEKMWRHAWWRELRAVKEGKVRCCHVICCCCVMLRDTVGYL